MTPLHGLMGLPVSDENVKSSTPIHELIGCSPVSDEERLAVKLQDTAL